MKERMEKQKRTILPFLEAFAKWIALGLLIGIIGGVIGSLFHISVSRATSIRELHPWILYFMPMGGLAIVWLYRATGTEGKGTNDIIASVHFGEQVPPMLVPVIFLSTALTHLFGGSAGREGAALQIGGGIGYQIGRIFHLEEKDLPLATMCGMSGVFSALFGTPLTAAVFAMEVISVGVFYYAGLIPCILSALMGYGVSRLMGVPPTRFAAEMPPLHPWTIVLVIFLSIACAVVSILFCQGLHKTEKLFVRVLKNPYLRVFAGGALVVGLTVLAGKGDYNGAGMGIITQAMSGQADTWAWLWKILFTAVTIGCGFKGGEVVPTFFVGATFGCVFGGLLGLPAGFGAAIGLIAVFCGAVNCPIASMFLSVELFGSGDLLYFAIACGIGYMLSGYCGLYSSQTILYSKLRAQFINIHTK